MPRARTAPTVLIRQGDLVIERDPLRPSGRLLLLDGMEASYVDLADPSHLEFDYLRWMRIILRAAHARRVIHVGGGACSLARALAAEDPEGGQQVGEIDPRVLERARGQLGLRRTPGLRGCDRAPPADPRPGARRRGSGGAARARQRARRSRGPRAATDRRRAVGGL